MRAEQLYYVVKPVIPRVLQIALRRQIARHKRVKYAHVWPIDRSAAKKPINWQGWPGGKRFALVLSHDVDTWTGYRNVFNLAELEENLGFRSAFNFVPERYGKISLDLLDELRRRGFGVGVHGLKHDGKLFVSKPLFDRQAQRINAYLKEWKTDGFTSPSMHHNLDWMTALNIKYSISTFDTDPFEPQPDGVRTIFPFAVYKNSGQHSAISHQRSSSYELSAMSYELPSSSPLSPSPSKLPSSSGEASSPLTFSSSNLLNFFVELPYTLPQDSTLFIILQEKTIDIWKSKLDWIVEKGGMVLLNSHPDYMDFKGNGRDGLSYPVQRYIDFLEYVQRCYAGQYYHVLPAEISAFYRSTRLPHEMNRSCEDDSFKDQPTQQHNELNEPNEPNKLYEPYKPRTVSIRPLRVAMLSYSFYESDNRVRRYAETLARRGDQVDVISLRRAGQDPYNELNGVRVYRVQERTRNEKGKKDYFFKIIRFLVRSAALLTKMHLERPYDLVHVHSVPDFEVFATAVPKLTGAKVILDIHDIVPELYANKFKLDQTSSMFRSLVLVEQASAKFADHVIISNDLWRKTLCSRSVTGDKCVSVLNYPDEHIFLKEFTKKENGRFVFLYPGTLNYHQGLDVAVQAFNRIKDEAINSELHIVGEGPARKHLEEMVRKNGIEDRVLLKDPVTLDKIAGIMAAADVGIIPKRNDSFGGEAFSTKSLEFMSLGVPIIVSRTKIDQYYFNDSIVKFFEPENAQELAEAMLAMIRDKALRDRLAASGLEFARKNCWGQKKKIYLDLVDSLCAKSNTEK